MSNQDLALSLAIRSPQTISISGLDLNEIHVIQQTLSSNEDNTPCSGARPMLKSNLEAHNSCFRKFKSLSSVGTWANATHSSLPTSSSYQTILLDCQSLVARS